MLLKDDENIGEEDRKKLIQAFLNKKQELNDLKHREYDKLNSIKMVSLNIKNGVAQFKDLIDKLKKKLRYFKKTRAVWCRDPEVPEDPGRSLHNL